MEILTWAEYKARSTDKCGFVLTHYSKLFNAAHCRVNIKGLDFQLGYDDRYFTKEWNNQVNQFKESHLEHFVEITAEVVHEIKATLVNYESKLIEVNAMLAAGLSGTDYNGTKASQQHLEMMVNKYKRIVELLPSFEDVLLVEGSNNSKPNKTNQYQGKTNMTNLETLKDQIAKLESSIVIKQSEITSKQSEIDNFEYECSESDFDEFLDEIESEITVLGMTFYPSDILKSCDPIAYRCAKSDYESNFDLDDCEEYNDLKDELESLESELSDLESELDSLESEQD